MVECNPKIINRLSCYLLTIIKNQHIRKLLYSVMQQQWVWIHLIHSCKIATMTVFHNQNDALARRAFRVRIHVSFKMSKKLLAMSFMILVKCHQMSLGKRKKIKQWEGLCEMCLTLAEIKNTWSCFVLECHRVYRKTFKRVIICHDGNWLNARSYTLRMSVMLGI